MRSIAFHHLSRVAFGSALALPCRGEPGRGLDWDANVVNDDGSMRPQTYVSAVLPGS